MVLTFDGRVLVPVADPDDGERTAAALAPYLGPESSVLFVNVIEKAGGAPDKASVEQREDYAEEIFERARGPLADRAESVETAILFGTDVVETIFDAAEERDVEAVVFEPRGGNRFVELLTGDVARRLVKQAAVPVVALPRTDD
ncbi:universal stress protein UspA-like protein [Natrinema pellirubrum DSM 15624]|nr:universal stress protein [Natrinema pellirubrum]AGB32069.1 universal stress protein UspA-like protein [Natrinema pellirubrum DSM 15624]